MARVTFVVALDDGHDTLIDHSRSLLSVIEAEPDVEVAHLYLGTRRTGVGRRVARHLKELQHLPLRWISRREYQSRVDNDADRLHLVLATPYAENYPQWFRDTWPRVKTVYSGYGPPEIAAWPSGEFELPLFAQIDYLLSPGPRAAARFIESGASAEHAKWIGDPLMHRLRSYAMRRTELPAVLGETKDHRTTRILWAPHWTRVWLDGPGFSNWYLTVFDMLEALPRMGTVEVVFRPHGFLQSQRGGDSRLPKYASTLWAGDEYHSAREALGRFLSHANVRRSNRSLWSDLTSASHVVTDGISLFPYALAAGATTAIVRRQDSPALAAAGTALLDVADTVAPGEETVAWLTAQATAETLPDTSRIERQHRALDSFYPVHRAAPGELLLDWIRLTEGPEWVR